MISVGDRLSTIRFKTWAGYGIFFLLAWLVFVVINLPVSWVVNNAGVSKSQVSSQVWSGTVWSGGATQMTVAEKVTFAQCQWDTRLLPMLWLTVTVDWQCSGESSQGSGEIDYRLLTQQLDFHQTDVSLPAALFSDRIKNLGAEVSGQISAIVADASLDSDGQLTAITGHLLWEQAEVNVAKERWLLADIKAQLVTKEEVLSAQVSDLGKGVLATDVTASLQPDGRYRYDGTIKLRDSSLTRLKGVLSMLGKSRPDGSVLVRGSGRLPG